LDSIVDANKQRSKIDEQRFDELYGLLPQQTEPYTHIINASDLNAQEVLASVLHILEEY
jgi:cytidylate kinase